MSQGAFGVSNNGALTTNYTNDTAWIYLGLTPFTGPPVDWTQVQTGSTTTTNVGGVIDITGGSSWNVSGTGGSGKILSMTLRTDTNEFDQKSVFVVLQTGGGTFTSGAGNTFNPPPPCFVAGTRVLTQNGYKAIETLMMKDMIVLSDGRVVDYDMKKIVVESTTTATAPYRIDAGAFGKDKPATDICLSPHHKIQIRKGVWISPERAAKTNPKVKQYGIGEPVTYWHIATANYLKDNLVCEGLVVESLATNKNYTGPVQVYIWSNRLGGFTRPAASNAPKQLAVD